MLTEDKTEATKMSEFGRTLYSFMLTRGIERRQDLLEKLNRGGYKISQTRLSYYLNGDRTADPLFVMCVSELLDLTKEERRKLAWVYTNGQVRITREVRELLKTFRQLD